MKVRALLLAGGLGIATIAAADAKDHRPKSTNANVQHSVKKGKKVKPMKYKAPKKSKKTSAAKRGVKHV